VTYQGKSGHAIQSVFDTSGRPPVRAARRAAPRGPAYIDDDDVVVDGPAPRGYVRVPAPRVYADPPPYYYRPYWGPFWGPRWWW
jgi:hypothetical protein